MKNDEIVIQISKHIINKKDIWWVKYLKDNPIKILGGLGLFSGGILFLMYYLYIGYMPHLENLGNLTYLLFVMSISGILLLFSLFFMIAVPAFYYLFVSNKDANYINRLEFIFTLGVPSSILFVAVIYEWINSNMIWIFISISIPLVVFFFYKKYTKKSLKKEYAIHVLLLSFLGCIPLVAYITLILSSQLNISTKEDVIELFFLYLPMTIVLNLVIVIRATQDTLKWKYLATIGLFVYIIFTITTFYFIPSTIMHKFHLGDFIVKEIYVSQKGCQLLLDKNSSKFKIEKYNVGCKVAGEICVLSNLGTNILLNIDENKTIELLSKDVTSMIIDRSDNRRCVVYRPKSKMK